MLELRQLTVLRAVAREGSLAGRPGRCTTASRPWLTTWPPWSRTSGVALVSPDDPRRLTHRPRTSSSSTTPRRCSTGLASAEAEVKALARHGVATLRIGTFPTAGAHVLPRAVAAVQVRTAVQVELYEAEPPELLERLHARRAALRADLRRPRTLRSTRSTSSRW